MKDWQFWTFITFIWILGGIAAPFPLDIIFFIGAFAIGIFTLFIQASEQRLDFLERRLQRLQFEILHEDLEEIKKLLGNKRLKTQKEVKDGNKQKRV